MLTSSVISKYAQYHPTHGKPWPGGLKIIFQEFSLRKPPTSSRNVYFGAGPQSLKRMEVDCWYHQEPSWAPQSSREWRGRGGGGWGKSPYLLIFSFFKQPQFWSVPWGVLPFIWYIGIWHVTSRVKHLLCKYNFQRILWLLTESKQWKWLFPGLLHITILFHPTVPDHLEILFQWHKWNCTFLAGKTTDFVNSEVNC